MSTQRDTWWVLRSAAVIAIVTLSAIQSVWLCYAVDAEQRLASAAEAAAIEASLPSTSPQRIADVAVFRLAFLKPQVLANRIGLSHNKSPYTRRTRPRPGDVVEVTISLPAADLIPRWLATFGGWFGHERITAVAHRTL